MSIPMLKADTNVGRYLPNNSNFLDRTIACRVDVLEDGIDHLLLADGTIGSADEGYPAVGWPVLDDDTAGFCR